MSRPYKKVQQKYDCMVKIIVVGDSAVGKTNLLLRFVDNQFKINHLTTIGVDFKIKTLQVGQKRIKMQIWDTAGQQKFRNIAQTYYKGAAGIILVYSITDRNSFENIRVWIKKISQSSDETVSKVIVGNKSDKGSQRKVTTQQGRRLAQSYNCPFFESSAKQNINVLNIFQTLAEQLKSKINQDQLFSAQNTHKIKNNNQIQKKCQC